MKMTKQQFRAGRLRLGLSVKQMAEILDTNASTIARWEAPESASTMTPLNPTAARVMQWLLDGFRPPQWPNQMRAQRRGPIPRKTEVIED